MYFDELLCKHCSIILQFYWNKNLDQKGVLSIGFRFRVRQERLWVKKRYSRERWGQRYPIKSLVEENQIFRFKRNILNFSVACSSWVTFPSSHAHSSGGSLLFSPYFQLLGENSRRFYSIWLDRVKIHAVFTVWLERNLRL